MKLHRALERFPRDRYPIKHASVSRALAHELAITGSSEEAEEALNAALEIYGTKLPIERAETLNSLGAVLRDRGLLSDAQRAFREAIEIFESLAQTTELAVSHFNLGLVQLQNGDTGDAVGSLRRASALLEEQGHPAELGAALRELGAALILEGEPHDAIQPLERSAELAAQGSDRTGLGSSANLIGLAKMALGNEQSAIEAFAEAASAHALTVRPDGHAMAKANMALAYEAIGDRDRARQAAQHASSIPGAPEPVLAQVNSLLQRLGSDYDLHSMLDGTEAGVWALILRDEVRHWLRCQEGTRRSLVGGWVLGQSNRPNVALERYAALFEAMLELEPENFDALAGDLAQATSAMSDPEAEALRAQASRAAARFRLPQMKRIEGALRLSS